MNQKKLNVRETKIVQETNNHLIRNLTIRIGIQG